MRDGMDTGSNDALRALAAARTRPAPPPPTPQCERRVVVETGPNGFPTADAIATRRLKLERKGMDPDLCAHRSSYKVGSHHYCGHHAGIVALEALIDAGRAERTGPDE